jgi:branched-chain amino acid transport system ATP-binding protein
MTAMSTGTSTAPDSRAASHLLAARDLAKSYGRLQVLDSVSLHVDQGEVLGVVGPNGAGKSTLLNLLSGVDRPDAGRVWLDGQEITKMPAPVRSRRGIGRSYQVPRPFEDMTVFENVLVASRFGAARGEREARRRCVEVLHRTGLGARANEPAGALRLLDRKRLELARALATEPRVVLLDEIAGGLTEHELPPLVDTIRELRETGMAVLWIEHVVHALLAAADRLVCLTYGRVVAEGDPQEVMASDAVQQSYLGADLEEEQDEDREEGR